MPDRVSRTTITAPELRFRNSREGDRDLESESCLDPVTDNDHHQVIRTVDWTALFHAPGSPIQLLEIGYGMRRFRHLLSSTLQTDLRILYDVLHPSPDDPASNRPSLLRLSQPRHIFHATLETFSASESPVAYDIVWAIHSFPPPNLSPASLSSIRRILHPHRGTAIFALAKQTAFCHRMAAHYAQVFSAHGSRSSLPTAEQIFASLQAAGMHAIVRELDCTHGISLRDEHRLDRYLRLCAGDDSPSQTWRDHPRVKEFLESFRHGTSYRFPHPLWVILSVPPESGATGRHRLYRYLKPVSTQLVA